MPVGTSEFRVRACLLLVCFLGLMFGVDLMRFASSTWRKTYGVAVSMLRANCLFFTVFWSSGPDP